MCFFPKKQLHSWSLISLFFKKTKVSFKSFIHSFFTKKYLWYKVLQAKLAAQTATLTALFLDDNIHQIITAIAARLYQAARCDLIHSMENVASTND